MAVILDQFGRPVGQTPARTLLDVIGDAGVRAIKNQMAIMRRFEAEERVRALRTSVGAPAVVGAGDTIAVRIPVRYQLRVNQEDAPKFARVEGISADPS